MMWRRRRTPSRVTTNAPRITYTKDGIPGDPLNLAVVATEEDLTRAMTTAGWLPADKITVRSSTKIATATIFGRPYKTAHEGNLFLFGRKQDLAFQQPVGNDPSKRHHVRFWQSKELDDCGRPMWFGAATYDSKVGLSRTTLQITHHIAPDVDTERDKVIADLEKVGILFSPGCDWRDGFHEKCEGRNGGGGDRYHTDGRLVIATIALRDMTE